MPNPLTREPATPDEADEQQADLFPDDRLSDWPAAESEASLAYVATDDGEAVETDADELEATMMSNLEAVASAFWVETGPELAPRDDADEQPDVESWPGAPSFDPGGEDWDFREPKNEKLVGPRRGALLDFRPPRARRERPTPASRKESAVDARRNPKGGAFADDLAARNKEFYDLLRAPGAAPRKIPSPAEAPAVRPGARSFFDGDSRAPFVPEAPAQRRGFGRYAVALGVLLVALGAGAAVIAARSGSLAEPSGAAAATADDRDGALSSGEAAAAPVVKDDSSRAPSEAVPKVVRTERITASDTGPAIASAPPVDPGSLATPPLYESANAPTDSAPTGSGADPLASLNLRPTGAAAPPAGDPRAADEAVQAETADSPVIASNPPAAPTDDEPAPAQKPAPKKVAAASPKTESPKPLRGATGSATVNQAVNMRGGPDNSARVIKVVPAGARVDVVACKAWCEIIVGGDRGYVFKRFLDRPSAPQALGPAAKAEVVKASAETNDHQPFDLLRLVSPGN